MPNSIINKIAQAFWLATASLFFLTVSCTTTSTNGSNNGDDSKFEAVAPRLAAGLDHTILLSNTGNVYTFGWGNYGQLGHGDTNDRLIPTLIEHPNLSEKIVTDVAAGWNHVVLLTRDGEVYTFGRGDYGQLGHGEASNKMIPTLIEHTNLSEKTITAVATGLDQTILLADDGSVFTFGRGDLGALGHGDEDNKMVPKILDHENLSEKTIIDISGGSHTVLLASDGTVFTFGHGGYGQLGHGDEDNKNIPVPIEHDNLSGKTIIAVKAGTHHTILLANDGSVFTFGQGSLGRLGHGDTDNKLIPTLIEHPNILDKTITNGTAGRFHTVLLASDDSIFTFGNGTHGQLGHGETGDRETPTLIEHSNLSSKTIESITAGWHHNMLLTSDGSVYTFGMGRSGQLGHGDADNRLEPTLIENINLID